MAMRYLSTRLATDFSSDADDGNPHMLFFVRSCLEKLNSNPDYNMAAVQEWWIEFDEEGRPDREIGLRDDGVVVLAGPDDNNYGFWLDTNMMFTDFEGTEIQASKFEQKWNAWFSEQDG